MCLRPVTSKSSSPTAVAWGSRKTRKSSSSHKLLAASQTGSRGKGQRSEGSALVVLAHRLRQLKTESPRQGISQHNLRAQILYKRRDSQQQEDDYQEANQPYASIFMKLPPGDRLQTSSNVTRSSHGDGAFLLSGAKGPMFRWLTLLEARSPSFRGGAQ